jgi:hypothetical protein
MKRPERIANSLLPFSDGVKIRGASPVLPPYAFVAWHRQNCVLLYRYVLFTLLEWGKSDIQISWLDSGILIMTDNWLKAAVDRKVRIQKTMVASMSPTRFDVYRDSRQTLYFIPTRVPSRSLKAYSSAAHVQHQWGKVFSLLHVVQTGSRVQPTSYAEGTGIKAVGAWSWPLTFNLCRGQENVDLYIHSPIRLHGVVLTSYNITIIFITCIYRHT